MAWEGSPHHHCPLTAVEVRQLSTPARAAPAPVPPALVLAPAGAAPTAIPVAIGHSSDGPSAAYVAADAHWSSNAVNAVAAVTAMATTNRRAATTMFHCLAFDIAHILSHAV